jgi:predicted nucleic acid-binding protein
VDASVTLAWCFEDEGGTYASGVLGTLRSGDAVAASHWGLEVANGLLVAERRGRISPEGARRAARLILALPIAVDPVSRGRSIEGVHRIGRTHDLSSYDAAYLELAIRDGLAIATLDEALRSAAVREGVPLVDPVA